MTNKRITEVRNQLTLAIAGASSDRAAPRQSASVFMVVHTLLVQHEMRDNSAYVQTPDIFSHVIGI